MVDPSAAKPLYEQIKEYILYNIQSGVFSANARIPSERDLANQFGVSRLTVSKAIQELVRDGRLYVQIGKGTFIAGETIDQGLESLTSFTEEMRQRGQITSSRVLQAVQRPAPDLIARKLSIPLGVSVNTLQRVRLANNQPIALETASIVAANCPDLLRKYDFAVESLYQTLREKYDIVLTRAEQTIEARRAHDFEADMLELNKGAPILHITRVTFDDDNTPIEYVESAYRGDRYKFRAILRHV